MKSSHPQASVARATADIITNDRLGALDNDLEKFLPLWKIAVPAEFETYHAWDFARFDRGERFVYQRIPQSEFDETLAQVKRWGLDQYLEERDFGALTAATTT